MVASRQKVGVARQATVRAGGEGRRGAGRGAAVSRREPARRTVAGKRRKVELHGKGHVRLHLWGQSRRRSHGRSKEEARWLALAMLLSWMVKRFRWRVRKFGVRATCSRRGRGRESSRGDCTEIARRLHGLAPAPTWRRAVPWRPRPPLRRSPACPRTPRTCTRPGVVARNRPAPDGDTEEGAVQARCR